MYFFEPLICSLLPLCLFQILLRHIQQQYAWNKWHTQTLFMPSHSSKISNICVTQFCLTPLSSTSCALKKLLLAMVQRRWCTSTITGSWYKNQVECSWRVFEAQGCKVGGTRIVTNWNLLNGSKFFVNNANWYWKFQELGVKNTNWDLSNRNLALKCSNFPLETY
jgi:hypothetical protein